MPDDTIAASPFAGGESSAAADSPPFPPRWGNLATLPGFSPLAGITMQTLTGEKLMFNFVRLAPNSEVPNHHHPHEQAGTILEGVMYLTVGDETRSLRFGDCYVIPPNVPHRGVTDDEGCLVVDVFSPPREDYLRALEAAAKGD